MDNINTNTSFSTYNSYFSLSNRFCIILLTIIVSWIINVLSKTMNPSKPQIITSHYMYFENVNKTNLNIAYEFINNITQTIYEGDWKNFSFHNAYFDHTQGEIEIKFMKLPLNPFIPLIEKEETWKLMLFLKDGKYVDKAFKGNITFALPKNFKYEWYNCIYTTKIEKDKPLTITISNTTITYNHLDIFEDNTVYSSTNDTNITLRFYPKHNFILEPYTNNYYSNWFSEIQLEMNSPLLNITTKKLKMTLPKNDSDKILNYSIIITVWSFFQIYYTINLLTELRDNPQIGSHLDLFTVSIQIIWDSLICAVHFYLAISNEKYSFYYGIPSMTYFIWFSVFELQIWFTSWKSRYSEMRWNETSRIRKLLLLFYILFYCLLFVSMFWIRYWYKHFIVVYTLFGTTWWWQIFYSAWYGIKPGYSYGYLTVFTCGKIFLPLYIKACPSNIFHLKPNYSKVWTISWTVVAEAIVIGWQKVFGPKCFIPKFLRTKGYDYYKNKKELEAFECYDTLNNDCVICWEAINQGKERLGNSWSTNASICEGISVDDRKNLDIKWKEDIGDGLLQEQHGLADRIWSYLRNKIAEMRKDKKYMLTPCNHVFHSKCLEKWLEWKVECPYCRRTIPRIDE